jgi:hypothetical protein
LARALSHEAARGIGLVRLTITTAAIDTGSPVGTATAETTLRANMVSPVTSTTTSKLESEFAAMNSPTGMT